MLVTQMMFSVTVRSPSYTAAALLLTIVDRKTPHNPTILSPPLLRVPFVTGVRSVMVPDDSVQLIVSSGAHVNNCRLSP
jgi:hypothetical protein